MVDFSHLTALESAGLMTLISVEPELVYGFRHALLQEVAYNSLMNSDKRLLHEAVGSVLEQMYPERLEEIAPILAVHFLESGEKSRSQHYFVIAGDTAKKIYANPEAELHYRRALKILVQRAGTEEDECETRLHLCRSLGRVLELQGHFEEALAHYTEMENLAVRLGDRALELAALIGCATIQSTSTSVFNPAMAKERSNRALQIARDIEDRPAEAKIYWILMLLGFFTNHFSEAEEFGDKALALAREIRQPELTAYILNDVVNYKYRRGADLDKGLTMLREVQDLWRELGNLPMLSDSLSSASQIYLYRGEFDQALNLSHESFHISESIGNLWGQSYALGISSQIYAFQGIADRAFSASEESLRIGGKEAGPRASVAIMSSTQAYLYARLGDMERGLKAAQEAVDSARLYAPFWNQQSLGVMAFVRVGRKELNIAQEIIRHAYDTSNQGENAIFQTFLYLAECELFLAKAEYENLLSYSRKIIKDLERKGTWAFIPDKLFYEGKAHTELGRREEARSVLLKALKKSEEIGLNPVTWNIQAALSDLEMKDGRQKAAIKYQQQSRRTLQLIVEHIDDEALRNKFLSQEEVKKIWESVRE